MKYHLYKVLRTNDIPSGFFNFEEKFSFKKNDILKYPVENFEGEYILLNGCLAVKSFSNDGQQITRFILTPPSTIGEIFAITNKKSYALFQFLENSEVLYINRRELRNLIKKDDEVFHFIFKSLQNKMKIFLTQYDESIFLHTDIKIAILLYEFAEEFGEEFEEYIKINFNITHELIGELLGIKRSTVIRGLNKLEADNIISYSNRHYLIKDLDVLENYIDENVLKCK